MEQVEIRQLLDLLGVQVNVENLALVSKTRKDLELPCKVDHAFLIVLFYAPHLPQQLLREEELVDLLQHGSDVIQHLANVRVELDFE